MVVGGREDPRLNDSRIGSQLSNRTQNVVGLNYTGVDCFIYLAAKFLRVSCYLGVRFHVKTVLNEACLEHSERGTLSIG